MNQQERIWTLLARQLAGEATEAELQELQHLLQQFPDISFPIDALHEHWQTSPAKDEEGTQAAFEKHMLRLKKKEEPATVPKEPRLPIAQRVVWKKTPRHTRLFQSLPGYDMLRNYSKTAFRSLLRNKTFSLINIAGLAIGMAAAIVLLLWIQNEWSFDQFHSKKDRIYQLYSRGRTNDNMEAWPSTPIPLGPALKASYPQVEESVRMNWVASFVLKHGDKQLASSGFLTDPAFFKVFDFPLLEGDPLTAFKEPHSLVVTEKLARRLFGDANDVVGQVIRIDSNVNFTITGVLKDLPSNTRFNFEYLMPWAYAREIGWDSPKWDYSSIQTYVLLKPAVTEQTANKLFAQVIHQHDNTTAIELFVHPMRKWNLWSEFVNGKISGGRITMVRLFFIIACFILLIACINYMNMSTARSERRAKEVGIRKVAGAGRAALMGQFILESVVIAFVAACIAMLLVKAVMPAFNKLIREEISIPYDSPAFWLSAAGFVLFTGLLAGSYPAFYLSAFKPVKVLKGTFKAMHTLVTPRKVLVVVQFSFAILFIICTLVIHRQIRFGQQREKGYKIDNLGFVYMQGDMRKHYALIKKELLGSGAATAVTRTSAPLTYIWSMDDGYSWKGMDPKKKISFVKYLVDDDFTKTTGISLLQGRDIDTRNNPSDSTAMLLTQSTVKQMGLKHPIGQLIKSGNITWHVIGVIRDFIPGLPFHATMPIILQAPHEDWFGTITFRLNTSNKESLSKVGEIFKKYNPDYPFESYFLSDAYNTRFRSEQDIGMLAAIFAGLTIFISCLGLFALATYMAESRVKEIGVRKVLGASVAAIVGLLSTGFVKLIGISFLIATPIAWWLMNSWLQQYAYRIHISGWIFVLTGLISLLIAILSVSYQALRAALANPIKALRSE